MTSTLDAEKLDAFMQKVVVELGAVASAVLVRIGDRLGLYRALAEGGPMTSDELAEATSTHERYVREWLANQAAGGYLSYDPAGGRYTLPPEQALALATEDNPASVQGAFQVLAAAARAEPHVLEAFRNGGGVPWGAHDPELFEGTERFFRPGYAANLVEHWIPALEGMDSKLRDGATVADVGCGYGASTLLMARAYPRSRFTGFDSHRGSIDAARRRTDEAGLSGRVRFEVADAVSFPGTGFDLVAHFDSLHDMADPVGAARRVKQALAPGGSWMLVEPAAGDRIEDNLNPVGRLYYAASTLVCVPNSLAGHGPGLGAQAGEGRIRQVAEQAGFRRFRRATQTPFNAVYEAR